MRKLFLLSIPAAFLACTNSEISRRPKAAPDAVYYDYQVSAGEGDSLVTVTFQCHTYGGQGPGLRLKDSTAVLFDGRVMKADSSLYNGTLYEAVQVTDGFAGPHTVSFVDNSGKSHKEEFRFNPFELADEMPEQMKKMPFTIRLKNLAPEARDIRLIITDTSFGSRDVNEIVTVKNGEIIIKESQLANLANGPVSIEIQQEQEWPMKQTAKEGGRIGIRYSLRRELEFIR